MSVYRRPTKDGKAAAEYSYDFWIDGRRFSGRTGCTSRGEARGEERKRKDLARAEIAAAAERVAAPISIDLAASRFWRETGQFYRGNAGVTFEASLAWLVAEMGKDTALAATTTSKVAELVARRRGEGVSNATVNRTVTEPLRRLMRRAREAWGENVPSIRWKEHLLPEPRERVRSASSDEEARLLDAMPADYRPLVAFAILSGCRLAECIGLTWPAIDWGGRRISILGKGRKAATVPLTSAMRELLWPLRGQHPTAVFSYAAERTVHRNRTIWREKGVRYPVTYEGMKTAWRRASRDVADFRFHDTRHTAATRLLRSSGNLKLVQKLLRHEEIATTSKYAHTSDEDLREAMERVGQSHAQSHAEVVPDPKKAAG